MTKTPAVRPWERYLNCKASSCLSTHTVASASGSAQGGGSENGLSKTGPVMVMMTCLCGACLLREGRSYASGWGYQKGPSGSGEGGGQAGEGAEPGNPLKRFDAENGPEFWKLEYPVLQERVKKGYAQGAFAKKRGEKTVKMIFESTRGRLSHSDHSGIGPSGGPYFCTRSLTF